MEGLRRASDQAFVPSSQVNDLVVVTLSRLRGLISEAVQEAVREALIQVNAKSDNDSEWVNTRRLATELGVSKSTVARWRANGLPYARAVGGVVLYKRSDVDQFLESGKTSGA